jgi:signal transduction histidine kinase
VFEELEALEVQRGLEGLDGLRFVLADLKQNGEVIGQHGKRADSIIKGMLQHASGGTGKREPNTLNTLCKEYVALSYHGKRAQVPAFDAEIEQDLDPGVGMVEMVPQEIGRVLLNLLSNAFDAVHEHALQSGASYVPSVRIATRRVEGGVEVRVQDNGGGIPTEVRGRIFEPFFTTKPTGQGSTGLGLSLSYDIVTQGHGGTLEVESEEGQGAAFIMTLPG